MNTIKNGAIAFAVILFVALPVAAHADDLTSGDYTTSYTDSYPTDTTGAYTTSYTDAYPTDTTGAYTTSYTDSYPASSYSTPSYSYPSYSTGYSAPGVVSGGWYAGGSTGYTVPASSNSNAYTYAPYTSTNTAWNNGNTSTYAPTNTWDNGNTSTYAPTTNTAWDNGNTTNSGNTSTYAPVYSPTTIVTDSHNVSTVSNTSTTNNTWSPPAIVTLPPQVQTQTQVVYMGNSAPACNTCSCSYVYCQPVAYNNYQQTPYVTLSQLPYTGLDLGFWGTIAYWGFLVLWCLAAAYLVVVKKVQNRVLRSLNSFLFGEHAAVETSTLAFNGANATVHTSAPAPVYGAPVAHVDTTDDFILSQINRARS